MAYLVVEDDRVLADVLRTALAAGGHRPVIATTLAEAALVLETLEVRGLVVDLDLDGGVLDWLADLGLLHPPLARATVALAGGDVGDETRAKVEEVGAGLLLKPFTPSDLADAMRDHMLEHVHEPHRNLGGRRTGRPAQPTRDPHDDA